MTVIPINQLLEKIQQVETLLEKGLVEAAEAELIIMWESQEISAEDAQNLVKNLFYKFDQEENSVRHSDPRSSRLEVLEKVKYMLNSLNAQFSKEAHHDSSSDQ